MSKKTSVSEKQLTAALSQSDEAAFETIFHRFYESLYVFVYTRIRSGPLAQDLVQDAFSKLWMNRRSLNPDLGCKSYLFRIADRLLIDHYRRQSTQKAWQDEMKNQPDSYSPRSDMQITLQKCITDLPEPLREVFVLSRYQGFTYAEIAEQLGVSVKTIESRMSKVLQRLREILYEP